MRSFLLFSIVLLSAHWLSAQNAFFSETFDGGIPDDWSALEIQGNGAASANWTWTGQGPQGSFAIDPLFSTTANNGWMIFDSDLNCRQAPQEAWLVSPQIDGTGRNVVFLSFETYFRSFNDRPTVEVSVDSVNWTSFEIFPGILANDYGAAPDENPQTIQLDISEIAAGQSFWIAFRYLSDATINNGGDLVGCGYSWQLDDVTLSDVDTRAANDLSISESFFAIAPNLFTPASQVSPFGFTADISNIGSQDQVDATLSVTIIDANTTADVFEETLTIPLIEVDSSASDLLFENLFAVPDVPTVYQGIYKLEPMGGDENPADNLQSFQFVVTDTTFAKILEPTTGIRFGDSEFSYAYANCFYVPNGDGVFGRFASFFVVNTEELAGRPVNILTYKWDGDLNGDFAANEDEYEIVAFNEYVFTGEEDDWITVPLSIDGVGVPLEDDSYYFVAVQYATEDNQPMFIGASDEFNYLGTFFRSLEDGIPYFGGLLDVGGSGNYDYFFSEAFALPPAIDMTIDDNPNLFTNTINLLSDENKTALFPNPASDVMTLDVDLKEQQDLQIRILDMSGKLITERKLTSIKTTSSIFDVSNLVAGNYTMSLDTKNGSRTLKFSVVK